MRTASLHQMSHVLIHPSVVRTFRWAPAIEPPPFFGARRKAYANGSDAVPGPEDDPDGWETLDPVTVSGEVFGQRKVEFQYTVSALHQIEYKI